MSLARRIFTERRRVVLPLLIFLVLNVAVLVGVVLPLENSLEGADAARTKAELALAKARKDHKDVTDQRTSKTRADQELKKFYTEVLPKDFPSARNVTSFWLGRVAEQSRLKYRAGQYDAEELRGSYLMQYKGEVALFGDYADIRRFLYEVETAQEFVIIEKVGLSSPGMTQGSQQLELTLSVITYFAPDKGASK